MFGIYYFYIYRYVARLFLVVVVLVVVLFLLSSFGLRTEDLSLLNYTNLAWKMRFPSVVRLS